MTAEIDLAQVVDTCILGRAAEDGHFAILCAGATYPYELCAAVTRNGELGLIPQVDLACAELLVRDIRHSAPEEITLSVLSHPRLVMKKYGKRGYLYGSKDCGHLIVSLMIGAKAAAVPVRARVFTDEDQGRRVFSGQAPVVVARIAFGDGSADPFRPKVLGQLETAIPGVVIPSPETSRDIADPERISAMPEDYAILYVPPGNRRSASCFEPDYVAFDAVYTLRQGCGAIFVSSPRQRLQIRSEKPTEFKWLDSTGHLCQVRATPLCKTRSRERCFWSQK